MANVKNADTIDEIFGYPPKNILPITNKMIEKSMPVVEFIPSIPQFQTGQDLYKLNTAWNEYVSLVEAHKFKIPSEQKSIKMAFIADAFPTDTFSNEYGENFLQKFTDVASEGLASIAQVTGSRNLSQTFNALLKVGEESGGILGGIAGGINSGIGNVSSSIKNAGVKFPKILENAANVINVLGAGGRLDFPMVWKTSSFQPSYTFTVRLYNPYPQDNDYTKKYILAPLTAILLLGLPRKSPEAGVSAFTWPFFHQIICPGLFELNPGYISNITVVKGGDQQQISFQQHMSIVDIRIDIGSVYSSILADSSGTSNRPTVKKYIDILLQNKTPKVTTREKDNFESPNISGEITDRETNTLRSTSYTQDGSNSYSRLNNNQKYLNAVSAIANNSRISNTRNKLEQSVTKKLSPKATDVLQNTRVNNSIVSKYTELKSNITT